MYIQIIYLLLAFVLMSQPALAARGHERGNGGDIIICPEEVYFFDVFEAQFQYDLIYKKSVQVNLSEKVTALISRIEIINPQRANKFRAWAASFFSETSFVNAQLADVPDTGVGLIPYNCQLRQLIVQREPDVVLKYRYYIDERLWHLLSDDDKAAVVIHELFLRELRNQPFPNDNSVNARYFNALVLADEFKNLESAALSNLYQAANMSIHEYGNIFFDAHVKSSDTITQRYSLKDGWFQTLNKDLSLLKANHIFITADMSLSLNEQSFVRKHIDFLGQFNFLNDNLIMGPVAELSYMMFPAGPVNLSIPDLKIDQIESFHTTKSDSKIVFTLYKLTGAFNKYPITNNQLIWIEQNNNKILMFKKPLTISVKGQSEKIYKMSVNAENEILLNVNGKWIHAP